MDSKAKEERQPRHDELFVAINYDLSHAVGKLETLRNRIAGTEEPSGSGEMDATIVPPAPAEVYANSPGEIRDFSERICSAVNEIRNMVV